MPDVLESTNTTASIGVDDTYRGDLGFIGDRDWIAIDLDNRQAVQINLDGRGSDALDDPYLSIYDENGAFLDSNDDGGPGFNSQLTFVAPSAGTYYIEVDSFGSNLTGDYIVTTQEVEAPPPPDPLDSIAWNGSLDDTTVNVYFATRGETYDGYTSEGFNAYEQAQFLEVFDTVSTFTELEFTIVTDASDADLFLVLDTNEIGGAFLGYFNPPGTRNEGVGVFDATLWDRSAGGDLDRGGFGYVTVVHELLHGLGMAHPHDTGGGSSIMQGVTSAFNDYGDNNLNQGIYTVMTYNSGYWTGTNGSAPANASGGDFGFEGGAMALDIAYLQEQYGANMDHATGSNTYTLATENEAGTYWEAIWDAGGTDTIRHNGSDSAVIDLRAATLEYENGGGGYVSAVDGVQGGFTIANGVIIERATGGSGSDMITGNGANNVLNGRGGSDDISGGNGADRILGKGGSDTLDGGRGADFIKGGGGRDALHGGGGRDELLGGGGNDRLIGGGKADLLTGGGGRDELTGGGGADTFIFSSASHSRGNKVDVITDFRGNDTIDVSGIDAVQGRGGNQAFEFIGTAAFSEAGQIRIERDGSDLYVQADRDGDGRVDVEILIEDTSSLTAGDFIL